MILIEHLQKTRFIEDLRSNECLYVIDIIEEHLVESGETFQLENEVLQVFLDIVR